MMKVKEENKKVGLKFNIQKTKIMASGSITSWQIDVEAMETVAWAPKSLQMVTAAMKLKDIYLLLERKDKTNLDSVLKSKCIILPTKIHIVKVMVFLVVMYGYESWAIKKGDCPRFDAFNLWCWRRLFRVLWTVRRSN